MGPALPARLAFTGGVQQGSAEYVSLNEAARRVGVNPRVLRRACDRGELEIYSIGPRTLCVALADLEEWVRARPVGADDWARRLVGTRAGKQS